MTASTSMSVSACAIKQGGSGPRYIVLHLVGGLEELVSTHISHCTKQDITHVTTCKQSQHLRIHDHAVASALTRIVVQSCITGTIFSDSALSHGTLRLLQVFGICWLISYGGAAVQVASEDVILASGYNQQQLSHLAACSSQET